MIDLLVLLGPPGSGKSHLGELLAARLGLDWTEHEAMLVGRWDSKEAFVANKAAALRALEEDVEARLGRGGTVVFESTGLSDRPMLERLAASHRVAVVKLVVPRELCARRVADRASVSSARWAQRDRRWIGGPAEARRPREPERSQALREDFRGRRTKPGPPRRAEMLRSFRGRNTRGRHLEDDAASAGRFHDFWTREVAPSWRADLEAVTDAIAGDIAGVARTDEIVAQVARLLGRETIAR